ncbi:tRNA N(3)-methylcytidine methyltransferase METTL2-like [Ylistrum balloti]|uniref:tRNA N(3)-methylcytidine methyltransferase METTL2-like n=1 Tax=Ylistrum balloti TaxID=509963 RepID=UPI002905E175|nr:tRNA N(3)-methylcytidine methyltransferase METTL2-like [Ylistrum balloti]
MMSVLLRNLLRKARLPILKVQILSLADLRQTCSNTHVNCKESNKNRPPFGARPLVNPDNVFLFNNWDNVVWDDEQESDAMRITSHQLKDQLSDEQQAEYDDNAGNYWNKFYGQHNNRFFKDRHWLFTEFPELAPESTTISQEVSHDSQKNDSFSHYQESSETNDRLNLDPVSDCDVSGGSQSCGSDSQSKDNCDKLKDFSVQKITHLHTCENESGFPGQNAKFRIFEVGCGVGNTVFPVLRTNNDPNLMVYCCDFSSTAIQLVKVRQFSTGLISQCLKFCFKDVNYGSENYLNLCINFFRMQYVIDKLAKHLKPGGTIMFRDYGRYDLAQLRFKKGRCLSENFYVRGDGTRVYFFTQDELKDMFTKAGLKEKQNYIDRRLQVNRGRQLKMYRVWIQCKYTKPDSSHARVTGDHGQTTQNLQSGSNTPDTTETDQASGIEEETTELSCGSAL